MNVRRNTAALKTLCFSTALAGCDQTERQLSIALSPDVI
jgi:hypothetical protein